MTPPLILLIEDNLPTRRMVRQLVTKTPYRLIEVETGEAALEACLRETPHLMIIDLHLPGTLTGLDIARRIDFVPFFVLTGDNEDAMVKASTEAGALTYVVKPIDPDKFLPIVETALARANERRERRQLLTETRLVNQAIGVVMATHRLADRQAWERLRARANAERCPLTDIAGRVIQAHHQLIDAQRTLDAFAVADSSQSASALGRGRTVPAKAKTEPTHRDDRERKADG